MGCNFNSDTLHQFTVAQSHEWLETNGLGGWSSGTLSGANSRRYHGLLVAATKSPAERQVLVSKFEEALVANGKRIELGCSQYRGSVNPQGYRHLNNFTHNFFPCWEYQATGFQMLKTIAAVHGENTVLVIYEFLSAPPGAELEILPFVTQRHYHHLLKAESFKNLAATFNHDSLAISNNNLTPFVYITSPQANFEVDPKWYYNFHYAEEYQRGYDCEEDLFKPGTLKFKISKGAKIALIISTQPPSRRDPFQLFQSEQSRRMKLATNENAVDDFSRSLHLAADQFVVRRDPDQLTILAGYHWFTDWGRDTMIALPGLCLVTGKYKQARQILLTHLQRLNSGILANNFSDFGEPVAYNTIDATLWLFVTLYRYLQYTKDWEFIQHVMPILHDIIDSHVRGTHYGIHVTEDGLLAGGNPSVQLTWMDAKIGDWVVTPRQGKPVEVNALWVNALLIMTHFNAKLGHPIDADSYALRARVAQERFNELFWNGEGDYLFDYVDGSHRDTQLRPNQIIALALPFSIVPPERAKKILKIVEKHLLTPFGLRTLAPSSPGFQGVYSGTQITRDSAYHQGTVWAWLLGSFFTALVRYEGAVGRNRCKSFIEQFKPHLQEAGLGSISEIFDGIYPHVPRGSIAQAWSVGELLRSYTEDILGIGPEPL